MNSKKYDYVFKVVIIGDERVGKTTLLKRYLGEHGGDMDFKTANGHLKRLYVKKELEKGSTKVCLEIHDTMGQERFRSLTRSYYAGAHGCLICFDVNNQRSFDNLSSVWFQDTKNIRPNETMTVIKLLVGIIFPHETRTRDNETSVSRDRAEIEASQHDMEYMEVNLNEPDNIEMCFERVVELMIESRRHHRPKSTHEQSIKLGETRAPRDSTSKGSFCSC